jgi:hypothetical protein
MATLPPAPSTLGSLDGIGEVFSVVTQLGPGVRRLDPRHLRRIEELAHTKGVTCPRCGSARLSVGDIAHTHTGHVGMWLWCKDEDTHLGRSGRKQYFKFPLEEAGGIDFWG